MIDERLALLAQRHLVNIGNDPNDAEGHRFDEQTPTGTKCPRGHDPAPDRAARAPSLSASAAGVRASTIAGIRPKRTAVAATTAIAKARRRKSSAASARRGIGSAHWRRGVLLGSLATLAIGIAAIGLYGVLAYAVSQRTREIGIRIALGATSRDVLTMVLSDGLIVAIAGIAVGTASAWVLASGLAGLLYGIAPTDPTSFILASGSLLGLTIVASYIPARRATRIEPIQALRTE